MDELMIADVFLILKPLCDSFMNEPSAAKAEEIGKLVNRTSNTIVQKICENVMYPIIHHLKNNTLSKDNNIYLINTIRTVILKIRIESLKLFYEIYHCLRSQICHQQNTMELIETHEELKESVVLCLRDLIKNCSISTIEAFYTRSHAAFLSHGIYLTIKIARLEKSVSLRLSSIEAAMALLQVHDEVDTQDIVLCSQIADVIMLYLPGVVSGLLEIALGTDIQNHKVTMIAIRAWSRTVTLVMQDMPEEQNTTSLHSLSLDHIIIKDPNDLKKMKEVLENAKRTPDWYLSVSEKFKTIFTELDTLTKHSHFKVRRELSEGVSLLLLKCSRNMEPCFQTLLEILLTLSEDENIKVAEHAHETLKKIQEKCFQDKTMKSVVEIVEENLYNLLTKMPRIIRTSGESTQIVWLNRLAGYLKLLGKQRLSRILLSTSHLRKLLLTFVNITELDCSNVTLLEDLTITNFEETMYHTVSHSWKEFKFLFETNTIEKLYSIFKILGELSDQQILVDSILKMTLDVPKFRKELYLILNVILEVPSESTMQMGICKQVIEHYVQADYWNSPVKVSDETSLQMAQSNIVQCCLLLEGLGIIAKSLQQDYQYFLLKTLYLVIEKAGNEHSLLRLNGLKTLEIIAKSQELDTIGDLLRVNVDYISYHVTLKLRRVDRNPGVLNVITVVTNYSTMDFLPHLKDIVDDLLLQSSSTIQKRNAQSFLKVFYTFTLCIRRLSLKDKNNQNKGVCGDSKPMTPAEIIIKEITEFLEAKKNSKLYEVNDEADDKFDDNMMSNLEINDKYNEHNITDTDEEDKQKEIPKYVNMTKDIMKRCLHFLPAQDFSVSLLAMSTLKEGVFILKDWENDLLPIVHELWHPLVDRFQNPNPLVVNHAWQLLCCLAQVCFDFIRSRTLKQILPALSSFLKKSSKESYKKDIGSTYTYTQIFKLQKEILSQFGRVVINLKLIEKDTWNVLEIVEPYLDCLQHQQLQDCCVNMYKEISDYNTDLVWIKCVDIWHRLVEPVIPENDLNAWFSKIQDCKTESKFQQNVYKILIYIDAKRQIL